MVLILAVGTSNANNGATTTSEIPRGGIRKNSGPLLADVTGSMQMSLLMSRSYRIFHGINIPHMAGWLLNILLIYFEQVKAILYKKHYSIWKNWAEITAERMGGKDQPNTQQLIRYYSKIT